MELSDAELIELIELVLADMKAAKPMLTPQEARFAIIVLAEGGALPRPVRNRLADLIDKQAAEAA